MGKTAPIPTELLEGPREMMYVGHPSQHRAQGECFTVVFTDPAFVQTLKHKMRMPWDGDGLILTWHHFIYWEAVHSLALL